MDIRKWLDETVLPEQPPSPKLAGRPGVAPVLDPTPPERVPKGGLTRKRSTSDSSLLDARTTRKRSPPIERQADVVDGGGDSACSHRHEGSDRSSESSTSSRQYARQPRRKTRPERYEPASKDAKAREPQTHRHRKGESRKTKHKSRRRKAEKPGVGVVQSFHAKNVPKDRLTLKPREKLGIFNKGRVSSPVKGRGLPDLVFSEMKFLQKHKDQPEAAPEPGIPKKRRKKDSAHAKQDEISAYFTSVRPALAERDINTQAREGTRRASLPRGAESGPDRSSMVDNAIPTVEIPDKAPYLGVGSRGPRHESGSYISWSESIRAPSATPIRVQAGSTIDAGQLGPSHDGRDRVVTDVGDVLHSQAPPSVSRSRHLRDGSVGRFHVSSSTPANQRVSRSHSFPQRACSPRPPRGDERSRQRPTMEAALSASSTPAVIPSRSGPRRKGRLPSRGGSVQVNHTRHPPEKNKLVCHESDVPADEHSGSIVPSDDPQTSSTLGKLLRECNSAFDDQQSPVSASHGPESTLPGPTRVPSGGRPLPFSGPSGLIRSLPTVRFAGAEICRPRVPQYAGPSIYEEQERRRRVLEPPPAHEENVLQYPFSMEMEDEVVERHDDGLDYAYDEQYWTAEPQETAALGPDVETPVGAFVRGFEGEEGGATRLQRDEVVARGFWRPHRLY